MGTGQKILVGGIGGVIPVFMNLVVIDWGKVLAATDFDAFVVIGWAVRVTALFSLGAFWVWLHKNEHEPLAVFQLGMLAPMAITALLNAHNVETSTKEQLPKPDIRPSVEGAAPRNGVPAPDSLGWLPFTYAFTTSAAHASSQAAGEITGKDGAAMVLVPAGEFIMGTSESAYSRFVRGLLGEPTATVPDDETPAHQVYLDAFYMDKYEVTVGRYADFLEASGREKPRYWDEVRLDPRRDIPVIGVSWDDAKAYCSHYGKRLPTEAEWEKAARGTDGRIYPWGNRTPTAKLANYGKPWSPDFSRDVLKPVGSYEAGKSPYRIYDLAGSVWEWVADSYHRSYYANSPDRNPKGPSSGAFKVLRGGSWVGLQRNLRSADRAYSTPAYRIAILGVRCAQDAP